MGRLSRTVLLIGATLTLPPTAPRAQEEALVLTGVRVVDVEAGVVLQDQTVVISGNRVLEVGDRGTVQIHRTRGPSTSGATM